MEVKLISKDSLLTCTVLGILLAFRDDLTKANRFRHIIFSRNFGTLLSAQNINKIVTISCRKGKLNHEVQYF